jgi:aspartate/methionine/tyrosine aminotransferase
MRYKRMPIEIESPEQMGYDRIRNNLSESSYTDALFRDIGDLSPVLKDLALCYGSHGGHEGLRTLIVKDTPVFTKEDVLLTMGAAAGLFIIATTLLEPGDELIVVRPNYATNLETPRAIGARLRYIDLRFEDGFGLDLPAVERAITSRTKYISVTTPHNPTGVCLSHEELQSLAVLAKVSGIYLLVDETYRDMKYDEPLPLAATYGDNVISISSLSKTYGLPGLRIGWIICRDRRLMDSFLAAKEQIHICGSPLDEEVAFRYMQQRERHFQRITCDIREKFGIVKTWMQGQDDLEWIEPGGGCVCFPRIKRPEQTDIGRFYQVLLEKYGTYTGAGHWFEMPDHYMRIGFGWPAADRLEEGLKGIAESLRVSGRG